MWKCGDFLGLDETGLPKKLWAKECDWLLKNFDLRAEARTEDLGIRKLKQPDSFWKTLSWGMEHPKI